MKALLLITLAGCTATRPVMRAPVSHPTTQAEVERLKGRHAARAQGRAARRGCAMTAPRLRQRLIDAAHVMHERPALTPHDRRERDALAALLLEAAAVMPAPEPIELHAYVGAYEVNGDPHSVEVCALSRTEARRLIDEHMIETHGERFAVSMTRAWPDDGDAASADRRIIVAPGDVDAYMAG